MTAENPTASEGGASIAERIENFLSAQETPSTAQDEPPKDTDPDTATPETEVETPENGDSPDSDEPQLSLSDLAKYLGVEDSVLDVDEDGTIKVKTKIDGKEGAAKFQELVKSYQLQGHVDAKAREAAETQKQLAERVQQFEQYAQAEAQKLSQLAHIANQELMREVGEINWPELARNDPAEYVAKQAEFQARQGRVNQLVQAAQQQNSQWQQAQQFRYTQSLQQEATRLPTLIPEWADAKVAEAERSEMKAWMKSSGFSEEDIGAITRADVAAVFRKAMLYDKGRAAKNVTEKKVREAPKLVKPGQSKNASERTADSLRDMKLTIRKSGGKQGIAEYLIASGKV